MHIDSCAFKLNELQTVIDLLLLLRYWELFHGCLLFMLSYWLIILSWNRFLDKTTKYMHFNFLLNNRKIIIHKCCVPSTSITVQYPHSIAMQKRQTAQLLNGENIYLFAIWWFSTHSWKHWWRFFPVNHMYFHTRNRKMFHI